MNALFQYDAKCKPKHLTSWLFAWEDSFVFVQCLHRTGGSKARSYRRVARFPLLFAFSFDPDYFTALSRHITE